MIYKGNSNMEMIEEAYSKIGEWIMSHKLTKKQAMQPKNLAQMKKDLKIRPSTSALMKTIENHFKKAALEKAKGKKPNAAKPKKAAVVKKTAAKANPKKAGAASASAAKPIPSISSVVDGCEEARKNAQGHPVKGYSLSYRIWMLHNGAALRVKEDLKKYLQKEDITDPNVKITNSAADDAAHTFDLTKKQFIVGFHIILDKATLAGLGKMMAVLSEDEEAKKPSLWKTFLSGVAGVAQDLGKDASKKIELANEELKKKIGIVAVKAYVSYFCGKKLGEQVDSTYVFSGINEAGDMKGRISYYAAIEMQ